LPCGIFDKKNQRVHQYTRYRESLDLGGIIAFSLKMDTSYFKDLEAP
jgi:hypothetical protein